jgi:hypothetical protein
MAQTDVLPRTTLKSVEMAGTRSIRIGPFGRVRRETEAL